MERLKGIVGRAEWLEVDLLEVVDHRLEDQMALLLGCKKSCNLIR
jgi:hypothetical protein